MPDAELNHLLADGFDLEIVEAPIIDANMLVPKGESVKLGFGLGSARGWLGIGEIGMGIEDVQFLELLDPSEHAVKRSPQEYSQLHVPCTTNIITMRFVFQNSNILSAGFPLVLKAKLPPAKGFAAHLCMAYLLAPLATEGWLSG